MPRQRGASALDQYMKKQQGYNYVPQDESVTRSNRQRFCERCCWLWKGLCCPCIVCFKCCKSFAINHPIICCFMAVIVLSLLLITGYLSYCCLILSKASENSAICASKYGIFEC